MNASRNGKRRLCSQCLEIKQAEDAYACIYNNAWVCSRRCLHNAGDRTTACHGWDCGCTGYSKKRRLLREHRAQMSKMASVMDDTGTWREYHRRFGEQTFDEMTDSEMDEESDHEDPEDTLSRENEELKQALKEQDTLARAAAAMLEHSQAVRGLDRVRMQLEDTQGLR